VVPQNPLTPPETLEKLPRGSSRRIIAIHAISVPSDVPSLVLTDLAIRSLKSETRKDFWDTKLRGFGVRVGPHSKTFIVKVGNARKSVGSYDDTTLADARKRAMALKAAKPKAHNPTTFEQAYNAFKEFHIDLKRKTTRNSYTRMFDVYFLPELRHRTLESITYRQISAITDTFTDRPGEQRHVIAVGRTFFKFCVRRHFITANPMEGMQLPKHTPRDRVLTDAELKTIWQATADGKIFSNIVRLLILTGQRRGEISSLQTSWIKENEIVFPKEVTKNGREHHFPLGSTASSMIGKIIGEETTNVSKLIFPADGKPLTPFNGFSKSTTALNKKLGPDFKPWTLHDLRRTFATNLAKLGVRLEVTEKLLNHVSGSTGGIVGVYMKYNFQTEMRAAIVIWEEHLSALLD
jgi:integrase